MESWRHQWSKEIRDQIKDLEVLDSYNGLFFVIEDWVIIGLTIAISNMTYLLVNIFPSIMTKLVSFLVYFIAIVVIAARQRALADILHQASHDTLAANKQMNYFLGTFCSGYTLGYSLDTYRRSHVINHHAHLGTEMDPDKTHLEDEGLYLPKRGKSAVYDYLWRLLSPPGMIQYIRMLLNDRMLAQDESNQEKFIKWTYYLFCFIVISKFELWMIFFYYWIIPFCTAAAWIGGIIELMEHFPMMEKPFPRKEVLMTRNRFFYPIENFFLGVHYEGFHLVHHLFPRVPNWNFKKAHQILLNDPLYNFQCTRVEPGFINHFNEMLELSCDGKTRDEYFTLLNAIQQ